ncbi:BOS complex subunit NOMO1-like [Ornithodoros turicata]|uniref:BOS complex subunit NOMO1-like n=1 Tax=Ornithodoros turicata TaxID=34597 RepID=UPI0031391762
MAFQINFNEITLLLLALFKFVQLDDLVGCGGFIRSNVPINYSRVEVKLFTKLGSLKYQTEGAPNNGYYLIPLYDKGEYVLRVEPPSGWSFEPSSVELTVDGSTDACSAGKDIDFTFQGFSILGKVVSQGEDVGPPGVTVQLLDSAGNVLQVDTTGEGGAYGFSRVLPGEYTVLAKHLSWDVQDPRLAVKVTEDNAVISKSPRVAGYDVSGEVESEGDPIGGVHFILASESTIQDKARPADCKHSRPPAGFVLPSGLSFHCLVTSSKEGRFAFSAVAPGSYVLLPFYKGDHMEFDMAPSQVRFSVGHGSYKFDKRFQVRGFSVGGRVGLSNKGGGIAGAQVFLDGRHAATTAKDGTFRLENMKAGQYTVEVRAEGLAFESKSFKVTPATPQLPTIIPSHFKTCGTVEGGQRHLSIRSQHEKEPLTVTSDASGSFCASLRAGNYVIAPSVSQQEEKGGLRFIPSKMDFRVPMERGTLSFVQFQAEIRGSVKCVDSCSAGLKVALKGVASGVSKSVEVGEGGKFAFDGLSAGLYRISVDHPEWCWEKDHVEVRVAEGDVPGVVIRQKGFKVRVTSSHETQLNALHMGGGKHELVVPQGDSEHCLPKRGTYSMKASGCHEFEETDLKFDTEDPVTIVLTAIKHAVGGTIVTEENVTDLAVTATAKDGTNLAVSLVPVQSKEGKKKFVHRFQFMCAPGMEIELVPKSGRLLFSPAAVELTTSEDCDLDSAHFKGRVGLFIDGQIQPVLEGVKVVVRSGEEVHVTTESDAEGTFRVGPLDPQVDYEVDATKPGYVLKPTHKLGHFEAFKFAEVAIEVKEGGAPLSGVLVSLSGGSDYRNHSRSGEDGKVHFPNLSPGNYFLRPMMKEYRFTPPSKMVAVAEGAAVDVLVRAERVAFSCMGSVTSVTGEAEPGVALEAQGTGDNPACNSSQEEAVSEADGAFRLRGLLPNCSYVLRLKQSPTGVTGVNSHIERAAPPEIVLNIGSEDIVGTRVIVFRFFNQMDVTGKVQIDGKQPAHLKVRLFAEESPDQILQTTSVGPGGFFLLSPMTRDGRTYCVRVEGSSPTACFQGDAPYVHVPVPWKSPLAAPLMADTPEPLSGRPSLLIVLPLIIATLILLGGGGGGAQRGGRLKEAVVSLVATVRSLVRGAQGASEGRLEGSPAEQRRRARPRRT